jgi:O-antigen/teichoic acid export membrane protein
LFTDLSRELHELPGQRAGAWALADQAVTSGGNFLTLLVLARLLDPEAFGRFALIFGVIAVLNNIHSGLVVYPLTLDGATADIRHLRSTCTAALFTTALLAPLQMVIVAGACWYTAVGIWAPMITLVAWQGQETLRRTFTAHLLYARALSGDVVSYAGQVAVMVAFSRVSDVTTDRAFAIIAATSIAAGILQAFQLKPAAQAPHAAWRAARQFISTGRWAVVTHTLGVATPQVFLWTIAVFRGSASAAAFQALASLVTAINPVMFSSGNLIVAAAARAFVEADPRHAMRVSARYAAQGAVLAMPYIAVLLLTPGVVLSMVYGTASPYSHLQSELRLFAVYGCLAYVAHIAGSLLYGIGKSRSVCGAHAIGVAFLAIGIPVTVFGGLSAAIMAFIGTVVVRLAMHLYDLQSTMQAPDLITIAYTSAANEDTVGRTCLRS